MGFLLVLPVADSFIEYPVILTFNKDTHMKFVLENVEGIEGVDTIIVTYETKVDWNEKRRMCFLYSDATGFYGYPQDFLKYKARRDAVYGEQEFLIEEDDEFGDYTFNFEILGPTSEGQIFLPDASAKDPRF